MIVVYGISNCDKCRKAKNWFKKYGWSYRFHDFRKEGLDKKTLELWLERLPLKIIVNRRGITWRNLSKEQKQLIDFEDPILLLIKHPTLIKRPVIDLENSLLVGFDNSVVSVLEHSLH